MGEAYLETVRRVAGEVLGIPAERISAGSSLADLKASHSDFQLIYERSAEALGVDLPPIIESMPIYSIKAGDGTMWSLRYLAAVSQGAAALLERYTVHPVDDTIDSIAESLRQGRFVDSGRRRPALHTPMSGPAVAAWIVVPLLLLVVLLPLGVGYLEYRQCVCPAGTGAAEFILSRGYRADGPLLLSAVLLAIVFGGSILPGLLAMRREARLRRERGRL
jgi:hypothetical protein